MGGLRKHAKLAMSLLSSGKDPDWVKETTGISRQGIINAQRRLGMPVRKQGGQPGPISNQCYPIFSPEDSDLASLKWSSQGGYARLTTGTRQPIASRIVMERMLGRRLDKEELVDHINHTPLDDRRENLRVTNRFGNSQNRKPKPFRGTTKCCNQWKVQVRHKGHLYYLGLFSDRTEAAAAAAAKRKELGFLGSEVETT